MNVEVYFGPSGTGKTYTATHKYPNYKIINAPKGDTSAVWWDGYDNTKHDTIIFDEFTGWIPFNYFKSLCDEYPFRVEIKGTSVQFLAKNIIFTTNKHPSQWYNLTNDIDQTAFDRRINIVRYFPTVYKNCDKKYIDETPRIILD